MTLEHLVFPPILAVLGVGIPLVSLGGEADAAIVAGLVVVLVKITDLLVDKFNGKKNGNGVGGPQCMLHSSQVTETLHELRNATADLYAATRTIHTAVGQLEVLTRFVQPRRED